MKNLLKTPYSAHKNHIMKNKKSLIKKLLFTLTFLGTISFSQNKVNAEESPVCPDPSIIDITSIADFADETSFVALNRRGIL